MSDIVLYDYSGSICSQMARLALVEKGVSFRRREIDIMDNNEQFEPWYVALNPKAVVPTLKIADEIATDTIRIVNRVQSMDGPDLSGDQTTQAWLQDIMALHYGVLMYRRRLDAAGTAPQVVARGRLLAKLHNQRPDLRDVLSGRIEGNLRFQALLRDPKKINEHLEKTRLLVARLSTAVKKHPYIAGSHYSLADVFATAAIARFAIHGLQDWWAGTGLVDYYARMKARPSFQAASVLDEGSESDL
ncbi:MAG: glutathione S-transferase family protein [Pseudomonadota bacterium]